MKKLFFFLAPLLLSATAFSQGNSVQSLRVENHTNCRQYYEVVGSAGCACNPQDYQSGLIFINPGGVVTHTAATLGGTFVPTGKILAARISDSPAPFCTPPVQGTVSQPGICACFDPPCPSFTYVAKKVGSCIDCFADSSASPPVLQTRATWIPASCEGQAKLIFAPYP